MVCGGCSFLVMEYPMDPQESLTYCMAGTVAALPGRKVRKPDTGRGNHDVRYRLNSCFEVSVACTQLPNALVRNQEENDCPWSARYYESRTSAAEGSSGVISVLRAGPIRHHWTDIPRCRENPRYRSYLSRWANLWLRSSGMVSL